MNEQNEPRNVNDIRVHQKAASDIGRLLDVMELELQKECDAFQSLPGGDRRAYRRADDLYRVRNNLIGALALFSGQTAEQIENFLADADA